MGTWCRIRKYLKHLLTENPKDMNDTGPAFLNDLLPWSENLPDETIYLDFFPTFFSFAHWELRGSATIFLLSRRRCVIVGNTVQIIGIRGFL